MNVKQFIRFLATVTAILLTATYAVAQGNSGGHGNGGGNGGGGGGPSYQIVAFDPPSIPSTGSWVGDVNEDGLAVGAVEFAPDQYIGLYLDTHSDTYTTISDGLATGINDNGQMTGKTAAKVPAFWASPSSAPVELGVLPGGDNSTTWTNDINNEGIIVGHSGVLAAAWNVDAEGEIHGPYELPGWPGYSWTQATAVSQVSDTVAMATGYSFEEPAYEIGLRWTITVNADGSLTAGAPEDIGTLDGSAFGAAGYGINVWGDVCGDTAGWGLPVVAPNGGNMEELPVYRVETGAALSINDAGEIVGYALQVQHGSGTYNALLWLGGEEVDLNSYLPRRSGWHLLSARAITNGGLITGRGSFDVASRGFILIPN